MTALVPFSKLALLLKVRGGDTKSGPSGMFEAVSQKVHAGGVKAFIASVKAKPPPEGEVAVLFEAEIREMLRAGGA
jgi:hypothetical protein